MKRLAILGASGHGKVIAEIAETNGWNKVTFFDDDFSKVGKLEGWPVVGDLLSFHRMSSKFEAVIVGIGDNRIRASKYNWLNQIEITKVNLIHPSAFISKYAVLGIGSVIMPNVVVGAYTKIGNGVILNSNCTIEHDCKVDNFAHIGPGTSVGGGVIIGIQSLIGIGASVKNSVELGNNVTVGAGATVLDDVPNNVTVVGTPARII